jgi:C4-dicarboxylate transporter DctM subunit
MAALRSADGSLIRKRAASARGSQYLVIKNIAPDIPLSDIIWGTIRFVVLMFIAVVFCCLFPGIATWLPAIVMN